MFTADMGAGQFQFVAKEVGQCRARCDGTFVCVAINFECDRVFVHEALRLAG